MVGEAVPVVQRDGVRQQVALGHACRVVETAHEDGRLLQAEAPGDHFGWPQHGGALGLHCAVDEGEDRIGGRPGVCVLSGKADLPGFTFQENSP